MYTHLKRAITPCLLTALVILAAAFTPQWDTVSDYLTQATADANYAAISHAAEHYNGGSDEIATATNVHNGLMSAAQVSALEAAAGGGGLTADTTVNLLTTHTVSEKQALIDATPHSTNGYTLIFQFEDGTHTQSDSLVFDGFYGNGVIVIQGKSSETDSLHVNQAVYIDGTGLGSNEYAIYTSRNTCYALVRYLKIQIPDVSSCNGIRVNGSIQTDIAGCYVYGTAKTNANIAIYSGATCTEVRNTYVSNVNQGITSAKSILYSSNNDDTGTAPNYGLASLIGSTIGKNGTQPAGTTANEYTSAGGEIR